MITIKMIIIQTRVINLRRVLIAIRWWVLEWQIDVISSGSSQFIRRLVVVIEEITVVVIRRRCSHRVDVFQRGVHSSERRLIGLFFVDYHQHIVLVFLDINRLGWWDIVAKDLVVVVIVFDVVLVVLRLPIDLQNEVAAALLYHFGDRFARSSRDVDFVHSWYKVAASESRSVCDRIEADFANLARARVGKCEAVCDLVVAVDGWVRAAKDQCHVLHALQVRVDVRCFGLMVILSLIWRRGMMRRAFYVSLHAEVEWQKVVPVWGRATAWWRLRWARERWREQIADSERETTH